MAMTVADIGPSAPPTTLPGSTESLEPGYLTLLDDSPAKIEPVSGVPMSTGRRATGRRRG